MLIRSSIRALGASLLFASALTGLARAQVCTVDGPPIEITDGSGGFLGPLSAGDVFGRGLASPGDLDGDGIGDLVVGAPARSGSGWGAVWILFLNVDGTVKTSPSPVEIGDTEIKNLSGSGLGHGDGFGTSIAAIGDLDGDGAGDLAVGAYCYDGGGIVKSGAVWILFLNGPSQPGTLKACQKICNGSANFPSVLAYRDYFGVGIARLGDVDGDGNVDLGVGASNDDAGGTDQGAAYVLFLNNDGTVASHQKIFGGGGGFPAGELGAADLFGHGMGSIDANVDGVLELVVGAYGDDDGGPDRGAVWILFLDASGTVTDQQKISDTRGGFGGTLNDSDVFGGYGITSIGDFDSDGYEDLAVGAIGDDSGGTYTGAAWILFLNHGGTVRDHRKISQTQGCFSTSSALAYGDGLGCGLTYLDDLGGIPDTSVGVLAISAPWQDVGGNASVGVVYNTYLADHAWNPGFGYCFGDPPPYVGTPCPCGNNNDGSIPGSGCDNGVFASGANLTGGGVASVFDDSLVLHTTNLEPLNAGLYFQADNQVNNGHGYPWGSGLRCAGGNLVRLGVRFSDASGYSDTSDLAYTISARSATFGVTISPGDTKRYQCWYRTTDNPPCFDEPFNTSNGYEVQWRP